MAVELLSGWGQAACNWGDDLAPPIRDPRSLGRIGMFCPLDLFRLKELTRSSPINNLAGHLRLKTSASVFETGAENEKGISEGEEDAPPPICDLVIFNEPPVTDMIKRSEVFLKGQLTRRSSRQRINREPGCDSRSLLLPS